MARRKRIWLPTNFYHIVCRGNRREPLFFHDVDFLTYLYILRKVHEKHPFELASYCLMTNHIHIQLRSQAQSVSKVMSLINKRYANYFNNKYDFTGHVFEKRFYDRLISTRSGMLYVGRYIHLNPVEAGVTAFPEEYRWSSYRYYQGAETSQSPFMNFVLLDYFSGNLREKRDRFREFHEISEETHELEALSRMNNAGIQ
ncbi:transposase [Evansella sp. LMS18]|uniref:transposase n=1 Tax=Evansella sp. LMS18 TaxID=2924033 RepID=UPI0020D11FED|nr:transposase [Evansella sp. LMS18]UTR12019.1 transposase [Evansella sp. LMS18]